MQNFDFNSLYDDPPNASFQDKNWANQHPNTGEKNFDQQNSGSTNPEKFSHNSDGLESAKKQKKKRMNRLITFFLISTVTAFTFGLITGIKLTAKGAKESRIIDPHTQAFFNKISDKSTLAKSPVQEKKKTRGTSLADRNPYSKLYIKLFPSFSPKKAQKIARSLLEANFSVHYSQLSNGNYFLYTGPYQREETGIQKLDLLKSLTSIRKIGGKVKLIQR